MTDGHAAIAIASGIVTGLFLRSKLFSGVAHVYDDDQFWEVPSDDSSAKPTSTKVAPLNTTVING